MVAEGHVVGLAHDVVAEAHLFVPGSELSRTMFPESMHGIRGYVPAATAC
jgi:hypothetical protein